MRWDSTRSSHRAIGATPTGTGCLFSTGPNCYGTEKARRVAEWLAANGASETAHIRAYSDHVSDAPTFALASESWLVGRGDKFVRLAARHGWHAADFEDAAAGAVIGAR